jgi:glycine cleavage system H protein
MAAGILSYQLCDREFDCDRCPVERAMRMHSSSESGSGESRGSAPAAGAIGATGGCLYSRDHLWVRKGEEGSVRVGLQPAFASLLVDPKAIALPARGEKVSEREFCCWIILPGGTIPLRSPVSGRILETNAGITEEPHELCSHPMAQGWLFDVQPDTGTIGEHLVGREEADTLFAADMASFKEFMAESLRGDPEGVGLTMADGGEIVREILGLLGPKRYCDLVRRAFLVSHE